MYKKVKNALTGLEVNIVMRIADNAFIPFDPANTDYQKYLAWLEEGNTPQEADDAIN